MLQTPLCNVHCQSSLSSFSLVCSTVPDIKDFEGAHDPAVNVKLISVCCCCRRLKELLVDCDIESSMNFNIDPNAKEVSIYVQYVVTMCTMINYHCDKFVWLYRNFVWAQFCRFVSVMKFSIIECSGVLTVSVHKCWNMLVDITI